MDIAIHDMMKLPNVWFYLFAAGTIITALAVVFSKNIVHWCMYLGATFVGVAAMYILLDAAFLAAVQVLIYVGAVTVLILFAVLLSQKIGGASLIQHNSQSVPAAVLVAVLIWGVISTVAVEVGKCCMGDAAKVPPGTVREIGISLLSWYVVPFEVASVVLLVAMIGAIIIARKDD